MSNRNSEQLTLVQTLKNEGRVPDSLKHFRDFLRIRDDTEDEPSEVMGEAETRLQFVLDVDSSADFAAMAAKYFDRKSSTRLGLTDVALAKELADILTKADVTEAVKKEKLQRAKIDVLQELAKVHESWVADLYAKNILEDRSNTTFFNGFLAK